MVVIDLAPDSPLKPEPSTAIDTAQLGQIGSVMSMI